LLVELVLTELNLVTVSLNHDLLDLILLDRLVDSVFLAWGESGQLIKTVSSRGHIVAIKRDTELLTDLRVINRGDTLGLLLLELFLGSLNLTCEHH